PSGVSPAVQVGNPFSFSDFIISCIAITLQVAFKSGQYMIGSLTATPRLIIKEYGPIYGTMMYPIITLMCFSFFSRIHHLYGCFITLQIAFGANILEQVLIKDIDDFKALPGPAFQGGGC